MEKNIFSLYVDHKCVDTFKTIDEAEQGFEKSLKDNPKSTIFVLSADKEIVIAQINQ